MSVFFAVVPSTTSVIDDSTVSGTTTYSSYEI